MIKHKSHGSDKTMQVGYANHLYRSAHKFEQICRHTLRCQTVVYSDALQPQSHLSFCVLLQYLVERRRVVFFFSSRRRHTRLVSDWSSDVCSSDLDRGCAEVLRGPEPCRCRG